MTWTILRRTFLPSAEVSLHPRHLIRVANPRVVILRDERVAPPRFERGERRPATASPGGFPDTVRRLPDGSRRCRAYLPAPVFPVANGLRRETIPVHPMRALGRSRGSDDDFAAWLGVPSSSRV